MPAPCSMFHVEPWDTEQVRRADPAPSSALPVPRALRIPCSTWNLQGGVPSGAASAGRVTGTPWRCSTWNTLGRIWPVWRGSGRGRSSSLTHVPRGTFSGGRSTWNAASSLAGPRPAQGWPEWPESWSSGQMFHVEHQGDAVWSASHDRHASGAQPGRSTWNILAGGFVSSSCAEPGSEGPAQPSATIHSVSQPLVSQRIKNQLDRRSTDALRSGVREIRAPAGCQRILIYVTYCEIIR